MAEADRLYLLGGDKCRQDADIWRDAISEIPKERGVTFPQMLTRTSRNASERSRPLGMAWNEIIRYPWEEPHHIRHLLVTIFLRSHSPFAKNRHVANLILGTLNAGIEQIQVQAPDSRSTRFFSVSFSFFFCVHEWVCASCGWVAHVKVHIEARGQPLSSICKGSLYLGVTDTGSLTRIRLATRKVPEIFLSLPSPVWRL